ncbi:MAG: hypothetical protein RIQ60_1595 [Pseudomonadota bacterium]|jgi:uncharacterized membrane protein
MSVQSQIRVRRVRTLQPLGWLERAWHDIRVTPALSFGHGLLLALFGWLLLLLAHHRFWVLAGAFSGFLLVTPVLATGLYAVSRAIEHGERVDAQTVWRVWRSFDRRLVAFGVLLALAGTGWVVTSAALITLYAPAPVNMPADFLRVVVANTHSWLFEAWLALGALLAAPVFASSVVALPLLLDREITVYDAVLASWRVVLDNPEAMAVWAALVMGFCLLGLGAALIGLTFVIPMLGHASWYAYRDLLDASALPEMQR